MCIHALWCNGGHALLVGRAAWVRGRGCLGGWVTGLGEWVVHVESMVGLTAAVPGCCCEWDCGGRSWVPGLVLVPACVCAACCQPRVPEWLGLPAVIQRGELVIE